MSVENELRFQDGGEGKLDTGIVEGQDYVAAIQTFQPALEAFAFAHRRGQRRGQFHLGVMTAPTGEVRQPGQRPVDAGRRHFDFIIAFDRILGFDEVEHRMRQDGAAFDIHAAVGPFGHDLQRLGGAAHDAQAHKLEARLFNDGLKDRLQM